MDSQKSKMIGMIGAGVSNMTFLHYFKNNLRFKVTLFEKSKIVSGRVATRRVNGMNYDNGANYLFTKHPEIINLITKELDNSDLITINKYIYPFDKNNKINFNQEEAREHNLLTKYSYKQGIRQLGKLLHNQIQDKVEIQFNKNVTKIVEKMPNHYELFSENESLGLYDALVFGIPSMNLIEVLKNSVFLDESKDLLNRSIKAVSESRYKIIYALAVAFQPKLNFDFYALVNTDREHSISWVSVENEKENHVNVEDTTLLIVQAGEKFSKEAYEKKLSDEETKNLMLGQLNDLVTETKSSKVTFSDLKRWKHALPTKGIDKSVVEELAKKRIYLIGDCLLDRGRVDESMMTGVNLAQLMNTAKF
jgi:renalase